MLMNCAYVTVANIFVASLYVGYRECLCHTLTLVVYYCSIFMHSGYQLYKALKTNEKEQTIR